VVEETRKRLIPRDAPGLAGRQEIKSPMSGNVWKLLVRQDEQVEAGQVLIILEAMKMENQIKAPVAGKVTSVSVSQGARVAAGETPLSALRHSVYVPASPSTGVPEIVAVPSPLSVNDTVPGRVDRLYVPKVALVIVAVGLPGVVTL